MAIHLRKKVSNPKVNDTLISHSFQIDDSIMIFLPSRALRTEWKLTAYELHGLTCLFEFWIKRKENCCFRLE